MSKIEFSEVIRFCFNNGVKVYPIYRNETNTWHLIVDNNGVKTIYEKQIKEGKILKGEEYQENLEKTYRFWYKLIKDKINGPN